MRLSNVQFKIILNYLQIPSPMDWISTFRPFCADLQIPHNLLCCAANKFEKMSSNSRFVPLVLKNGH